MIPHSRARAIDARPLPRFGRRVRRDTARAKATRAVARLVAPAFVAVVGCASPPSPPSEQVGRTSQEIIGGVASGPEHDAVVFVRSQADPASPWLDCTGTLISPHLVLTARHCVAAVQPGDFACAPNGDLEQNGSGSGLFGDLFAPSSITVHVGAQPTDAPAAVGTRILATSATSACRDDLAVVLLDRAIAAPWYPPVRAAGAMRAGEKVTVIGYGLGERTAGVERRELAGVRVVDVGASGVTDDPAATTPPRTFVVGGDTLCFGDSGGPALADGDSALVGVYSRVTGNCFATASRSTFMAIASYTALIDEAFAAAGETPNREATPPSTTDAGAAAPSGVDPAKGAAPPSAGAPAAIGCDASGARRAAPEDGAIALIVALGAIAGLRAFSDRRRSSSAAARSRSARSG